MAARPFLERDAAVIDTGAIAGHAWAELRDDRYRRANAKPATEARNDSFGRLVTAGSSPESGGRAASAGDEAATVCTAAPKDTRKPLA